MLDWRQSAGKTKALCYIIGVYLGDGCVTYNTDIRNKYPRRYFTFKINSIDLDFMEHVRDSLSIIIGNKDISIKKVESQRYVKGIIYNISVQDENLCQILVSLTNKKEFIPRLIFEETKDNKLEFLSGCMDSDGYVSIANNISSKSRFQLGIKKHKGWIDDLPYLLEMLGIRLKKREVCAPNKDGYEETIRLILDIESWILSGSYFNINRKNRKIQLYRESFMNPQRLYAEHESDDIVRSI